MNYWLTQSSLKGSLLFEPAPPPIYTEYTSTPSNTGSLGYKCRSLKHLQHEVCHLLNEGVHFMRLGTICHIFALASFRLQCTRTWSLSTQGIPVYTMTKLRTPVSEEYKYREQYRELAIISGWGRVVQVGAKYRWIGSSSLVLLITYIPQRLQVFEMGAISYTGS